MNTKNICFFLIFSLFLGCSDQPSTLESAKETNTYPWKLICIGDGNTAGVGLDHKQAYPLLLESTLREEFPTIKIVNAGIKGENIAGINQRIEWMLQQRFSAILIALNEDDVTANNKENWSKCLQKISQTNPDATIFIGVLKGDLSFASISAFFKPFTTSHNLTILDLNLNESETNHWWQSTGEHLSIAGQKELARRLLSPIKKVLNQ